MLNTFMQKAGSSDLNASFLGPVLHGIHFAQSLVHSAVFFVTLEGKNQFGRHMQATEVQRYNHSLTM